MTRHCNIQEKCWGLRDIPKPYKLGLSFMTIISVCTWYVQEATKNPLQHSSLPCLRQNIQSSGKFHSMVQDCDKERIILADDRKNNSLRFWEVAETSTYCTTV